MTNGNIPAIRRRRVESEKAYEGRRKELGLPTIAETRRREAEEGAALREQINTENTAKEAEESYWRGRARELRYEEMRWLVVR